MTNPRQDGDAPTGRWTDTRVEAIIGTLLRVGVLLAASVVLAGGALYLIRHPGEEPSRHVFHAEPKALTSVANVARSAASGSAQGIIQLGLLLLIATPIARVLFSVYAFHRQHDYLYVVLTLIVLTILLYSLIWGRV